jgi:sec-independent protein translocase protein TatA
MFGLGTSELIVIGVIVLLIFGAKRIPEIGKGLGGALREFRKVKRDLSNPEPDDDKKAQPSIEDKAAKKVLEQVPGVKKVMDINEKVKNIEKAIKK